MASYWELFKKVKKMYLSIGSMKHGSLKKKIEFNGLGFRHMVMKGKTRRKIGDQVRRFKLFLNIREAISLSRIIKEDKNFMVLASQIKDRTYRIILLKKQDKLIFISVMQEE